ncbi:ABC transporter [Sorangium cellulosum]|uniref:ABC transporter n=1 Tax=Sorangium cellulosum TaxID=56 RepID=A0A150PFW8_SORCE|nr:ABC transporter [Sorangium cellulosum]
MVSPAGGVRAAPASSDEPVLRVRGLHKAHALGATPIEVLRGVDLDIHAGEMCAIMGPSGVGKSTLLSCVAGLESPDRGEVRVLGEDMAALDEHGRTLLRRRRVGIVYQFFNLVPTLTGYENIVLPYLIDGAAPDHDAASRMLDRVGMRARAEHLPSQMSGGEMQLISIARALVRRPALVLADEPTGNVNVATGRRIMALLADALREAGSAMLLVTHNAEDAARAHRVVFMRDGLLLHDAALAGPAVTSAAVHDRLKELGI